VFQIFPYQNIYSENVLYTKHTHTYVLYKRLTGLLNLYKNKELRDELNDIRQGKKPSITHIYSDLTQKNVQGVTDANNG